MAGSVNKVILVGNLGQDPEIKTFQSGDRVAHLSIATSESWKDKQTGEKKERTEWHRVVVFNQGLINVVDNYIKKGMKLYIEGQLETRKWTDKDGNDKYMTEVVLRPFNGEITMLGGPGNGEAKKARDDYAAEQFAAARDVSSPPRTGAFVANELEDEIPF